MSRDGFSSSVRDFIYSVASRNEIGLLMVLNYVSVRVLLFCVGGFQVKSHNSLDILLFNLNCCNLY